MCSWVDKRSGPTPVVCGWWSEQSDGTGVMLAWVLPLNISSALRLHSPLVLGRTHALTDRNVFSVTLADLKYPQKVHLSPCFLCQRNDLSHLWPLTLHLLQLHCCGRGGGGSFVIQSTLFNNQFRGLFPVLCPLSGDCNYGCSEWTGVGWADSPAGVLVFHCLIQALWAEDNMKILFGMKLVVLQQFEPFFQQSCVWCWCELVQTAQWI